MKSGSHAKETEVFTYEQYRCVVKANHGTACVRANTQRDTYTMILIPHTPATQKWRGPSLSTCPGPDRKRILISTLEILKTCHVHNTCTHTRMHSQMRVVHSERIFYPAPSFFTH